MTICFSSFQPWLAADVLFAEFVRAEPLRCRPVLRLAQATVYEVTQWLEPCRRRVARLAHLLLAVML